MEFVQWDGALHALTLVRRRLRIRRLGPLPRIAGLVQRLPFALRRLAVTGPIERAAAALLADAVEQLDEILLGPLPELAERPLVVVPTGVLHSMPWSVLPSCTGRPVTVAPSATLWHKASCGTADGRGTAVAAAGPGLPGARTEAEAVAKIYGCAALLDDAATADNVLAAVADVGIAHLAAHGSLADENPLFSRLRLHDGPLVAYDIERLTTVPHTVVLASCDNGRSVVSTGDELLGLSASFIARGAVQLVASVAPIPDGETAPLMVALHRGIAMGLSAPVALAEAQRDMRERSARDFAAAAGFVSVGGERTDFRRAPGG